MPLLCCGPFTAFSLRVAALFLVVNVLMLLSFVVREAMYILMAITCILGSIVLCRGAGRLEKVHDLIIHELHLDEEYGMYLRIFFFMRSSRDVDTSVFCICTQDLKV